jgi:hypothetical protein
MRAVALALLLSAAVSTATVSTAVADQTTTWPAGARVYIVSPQDGARVKSPVTVVFGLKGLGIAPAGMKMENTGHHHLLVDTDVPADLNQPLPSTDHILHYGKGQTEVTLDAKQLPPGKHTLQLVFGDELHIPHSPALVSQKITITVE